MICTFEPKRYRRKQGPGLCAALAVTLGSWGAVAAAARMGAAAPLLEGMFLEAVFCLTVAVILGIRYLWLGHNLRRSRIELEGGRLRYIRRVAGDQAAERDAHFTAWRIYTVDAVASAVVKGRTLRLSGTIRLEELDEDETLKRRRTVTSLNIPLVFSEPEHLLAWAGVEAGGESR